MRAIKKIKNLLHILRYLQSILRYFWFFFWKKKSEKITVSLYCLETNRWKQKNNNFYHLFWVQNCIFQMFWAPWYSFCMLISVNTVQFALREYLHVGKQLHSITINVYQCKHLTEYLAKQKILILMHDMFFSLCIQCCLVTSV